MEVCRKRIRYPRWMDELVPIDHVPALDPTELDRAGEAAVRELIADGTAANTRRSYATAMRYWVGWFTLRYGRALDGPMSVPVVLQFVVDHLERVTESGSLEYELPAKVDERLQELGIKKKPGPLAFGTVRHRLAVLAHWHLLHSRWESPVGDYRVRTLMTRARQARSKRGIKVAKKPAATLEALQAMLETCTDGTRGVRDRALLLLGWAGGGRRRSEIVALQVDDLRRINSDTWVYTLGHTKTHRDGEAREIPLRGPAVVALQAWLDKLGRTEGPLFPRMFRGGQIGGKALTGDHVARIVQRRAGLAELDGDWSAHSLRSGFVTEGGRQGVPFSDLMAMTEHKSTTTALGYYQSGKLMESNATRLFRNKESGEDV